VVFCSSESGLKRGALTAAQCEAARGLLGWSQKKLSKEAFVALPKISAFESGLRSLYPQTLRDLKDALRAAGVEFVSATDGVRMANSSSSSETDCERSAACSLPASCGPGPRSAKEGVAHSLRSAAPPHFEQYLRELHATDLLPSGRVPSPSTSCPSDNSPLTKG
jgi:transcriptional regulator with XRE-family HTH domain